MEDDPSQSTPRRRFSTRSMMLVVAAIACLLAAISYRRKAFKPDLTISPADIAWAIDYKIWKIDLSEAGTIYGVQIVVFENGGTQKRRLVRCGGDTLIDTSKHPVVTIGAKYDSGNVTGKMAYGASVNFEAKNLFQGHSVSSVGKPVLNGNLYYLISDSQTVGFGEEPFEKASNAIALELLRTPNQP